MDTITLYYGFRESLEPETPFVSTLTVSKIENVKDITKGISISQYANLEKKPIGNSNFYAIGNFYALGTEEFTVCPLGMLVPSKNKKQHTIYVGQKVYATTKEDLCDYYREQAQKKHIKMQETLKVMQENLSKCASIRNDYVEQFWTDKIKYLIRNVKGTQDQYKKLIEKIKNL